jgi:hypothetical protein
MDRRRSGTVEHVDSEVSRNGEITSTLPTPMRTCLSYRLNELELRSCSASAMAAQIMVARWRFGHYDMVESKQRGRRGLGSSP